jgi:uncharacterized membrane protein
VVPNKFAVKHVLVRLSDYSVVRQAKKIPIYETYADGEMPTLGPLLNLTNEEKKVFEKIIEAQGSVFQSEIIDKTNFNKVKVSRILDKLEGLGLIERRRRGMTNIVILKH